MRFLALFAFVSVLGCGAPPGGKAPAAIGTLPPASSPAARSASGSVSASASANDVAVPSGTFAIHIPPSAKWPLELAAPALAFGAEQTTLVAERGTAAIAHIEPLASRWSTAPFVNVHLLPQQITAPRLLASSIPNVRVQALHDGESIAFRLVWNDDTPNGNVASGMFTDAAAVQLPIDAAASPMMGHPGGRVQILHWKALWQKDQDVGFQDVHTLYPNIWSDLYWFSPNAHPHPVQDIAADPYGRAWLIALSAGNSVALVNRSTPAQELIAEGFGTLTAQPESATTARGVWFDNTWVLVIERPLKTADPLDAPLSAGGKTQAAFAIWNGGDGNVGARKHWSAWVDLEVAK